MSKDNVLRGKFDTFSDGSYPCIILAMSNEVLFYGIRHGETAWNKEQRIQGHHDEPLSATGLTAVHTLGKEMRQSDIGQQISLLYSSDLSRARVTADVLAYYLNVPYRVDSKLRERNYGEFEGKTFTELEAEFGLDRIEGYQPPGGESLEEFDRRIGNAVIEILRSNPDQTILFVSHGGALRSKMRQFGNIDSNGIGFDLANLSLHSFQIPEITLSIGSAK